MTDYQRPGPAARAIALLGCAALLLCACSSADEDAVPAGPHPSLIVTGQLQSDELVEASGLARSQRRPDLLWSLNDGGSKARLYAFDEFGAQRGRIRVDGAKNRDWEDLASFTLDGSPYLLVADTGDNNARRKSAWLYVVPEPDLEADDKVRLEPAWSIKFHYPDGPHDTEAVAVDVAGERVLLLTKRDLPPVLYAVPLRPDSDDTVTAERLGTIKSLPRPSRQDRDNAKFTKDFHWQPTAMDLSPDGTLAVVLTTRAVYVYHVTPDRTLYQALSGQAYALGLGNFPHAEAAAFSADSQSIFVTLEGRHPPLLRIDINGALPE